MKLGSYILLFLLPLVTFGKETVYTVTAYCNCPACTGYYSGGPTASGAMARQGITIAAPRSIPFGTVLEIEGLGRRVVQDRLASSHDNRIDIFLRSHAAARRFGIKKLKVTDIASEKQ